MAGYSEADYDKMVEGAMSKRKRSRSAVEPTKLEPIQEETRDLSSSAAAEDTRASFGQNMAAAQGPSSSATDAVAQGAMMSGNPYAMGGGLALQTFSNIQKGKQEAKQAEYQNKVNALNNMANWAKGIRSL